MTATADGVEAGAGAGMLRMIRMEGTQICTGMVSAACREAEVEVYSGLTDQVPMLTRAPELRAAYRIQCAARAEIGTGLHEAAARSAATLMHPVVHPPGRRSVGVRAANVRS
mmetsp:Transcript_48466/g.87739  ORF Transcript_48466/g.87739 Transcript_48466/m.87739 type:complete len:112 (-) Transcript_48466:104-439(-)